VVDTNNDIPADLLDTSSDIPSDLLDTSNDIPADLLDTTPEILKPYDFAVQDMGLADPAEMKYSEDPKATRIGGTVAVEDIPRYTEQLGATIFSPFSFLVKQVARGFGGIGSMLGLGDYAKLTQENERTLGNIMNSLGYVASVVVDYGADKISGDKERTKLDFIDRVKNNWVSGKTLGQSYIDVMKQMGFNEGEYSSMLNQVASQGIDLATTLGTFKLAKGAGVTEQGGIKSGIEKANKSVTQEINAQNVIVDEIVKLEKMNEEVNRQVKIEQIAKGKEIAAKEATGQAVSPMEVVQNEIKLPGKVVKPIKTIKGDINKANAEMDLQEITPEIEETIKQGGYDSMQSFIIEQNNIIKEIQGNGDTNLKIGEKGQLIVEDVPMDSKMKATLGKMEVGTQKLRQKGVDIQNKIAKTGPVGELFSRQLTNIIYKSDKLSAEWKNPFRQNRIFQKFDKFLTSEKTKWGENLFDVVEKKLDKNGNLIKPLNETIAKAAEACKTSLKLIADKAVTEGKMITFADGSTLPFAPRDFYMPHNLMYDLYRKGGKYRQEGIFKIMQKPGLKEKMGAKTAEQALDILIKRHDDPNASNSVRNGNLAFAREANFDGYSRDLSVVEKYIDSASKEFAVDEVFGKDRMALEKSTNDWIRESGISDEQARSMVRMFSDIMPEGNKMGITESTLKQIYNMAKLPFITLGHLPQAAYLSRYPGLEVWKKNITTMVDEARKTGALEEEYRTFQNASKDYLSNWWISRKYMQGTGMTPFRLFIKGLSGEKAVNYAFDQLKSLQDNKIDNSQLQTVIRKNADQFVNRKEIITKYRNMVNAKARLAEFGIDPNKVLDRGYLTPEEILDVRRKGAAYVFGEQHPTNFPLWKSTGFVGRNMFMYRADQYINFKTITHDLIQKEGIERGNWKPVLKIVAVGAPLGAISATIVRKMVKGQPLLKDEQNVLDLYLQGALTAHFLGVAQDVYYSALYGSVANVVLGPMATEGTKLAKNTFTSNTEALKKQAVGLLPGGSIIAPRVYPKE